jgi:HAE1 family hydrophobic/amphiphilic exporter-1
MFVLVWVLLGAVSLPKMGIERTPPMDFPMVTTTLIYPGANPAEVEEQVIKPIENAISEVAQIKRLSAQAFESGGFVMAEFALGTDINHKLLEVKDKVEAIVQTLPKDLKRPRIEKLNIMQEPVLDIALYTDEDDPDFARRARVWVSESLSQKITSIAGVASVKVSGGLERAVRVDLNPTLMMSRGVAISDITGALGSQNLNFPGGRIEQGNASMQIRFVGEFEKVDDIANLLITTAEGGRFRLRDIASVSESARKRDNGARLDGADIVMISVVKATDGNAINIAKAINKKMPSYIDSANDALGNGAQLKIVSDTSISIMSETNSTMNGIMIGLVLTILTLLAFTRNWRTTIIAAVVIPASLVSGFLFMQASGFSINFLTQLAIATAMGSLIFNAILIIESALLLMHQGASPQDAAINGTKRVAVAVLAGAGTNMAVFLPIALMGGIAGLFMKQFGLSVVYLTILSILFSFSLTPMMIALMLRINKGHKEKVKVENKLFRKIFEYQFKKPFVVIGVSFGALILSGGLLSFVGNEFQPATDVSEISIIARAPRGATYQRSEEIASDIERRLKTFPEVRHTITDIGERGVENIRIIAQLVPISKRSLSDKQIVQKIVPLVSDMADADISVKAGKIMTGNASDLVLNITGDDNKIREEYAARAVDILNGISEIQSAKLSAQNPGYEYRFIPDNNKMKLYGVSNIAAAMALRAALDSNDDAKFRQNGEEIPIIVGIAEEFINPDMFDNIMAKSIKGLVPISELGQIQRAPASPNINRRDKARTTEIQIILGKSTIGPMQTKIKRELNRAMEWKTGYGFYFAGMGEIQAETSSEMGSAFMLAVLLTFMLLAAILNSFAHPFTIATGIAICFSGVFVMLFLVGAGINIAAMLAIIMLVGLSVNNNIIVLEPALIEIRKGGDAKKILWDIYADRTRMMVMTSVAVMSGMLPQLWSSESVKVSMGAVIIGGMLASLAFTYLLTPALFVAMERLRNFIIKKVNR